MPKALTPKPLPPEEAAGVSLFITYELPPDLALKLSAETIVYFNSLIEDEKRRRLKELGYVRSVSATASCELEFDQLAVNRQAAQKDRPDALGKLIESILSEAPELLTNHVLTKLKRDHKGKITIKGDLIECINDRGLPEYSQVSGLGDRVYRTRKRLKKKNALAG